MKALIAHILNAFKLLTATAAREKALLETLATRDATIAALQAENTKLAADALAAAAKDAEEDAVLQKRAEDAEAAAVAAKAELDALNAEAEAAAAELSALTDALNADPAVPIEGGQIVEPPAAEEPQPGAPE